MEIHTFKSSNQCLFWLVYSYIFIFQQFPTTILPLQMIFDLNHQIDHFVFHENLLDTFFLLHKKTDSSLPTVPNEDELISDLKEGRMHFLEIHCKNIIFIILALNRHFFESNGITKIILKIA